MCVCVCVCLSSIRIDATAACTPASLVCRLMSSKYLFLFLSLITISSFDQLSAENALNSCLEKKGGRGHPAVSQNSCKFYCNSPACL